MSQLELKYRPFAQSALPEQSQDEWKRYMYLVFMDSMNSDEVNCNDSDHQRFYVSGNNTEG
jgi:hypothetical protein